MTGKRVTVDFDAESYYLDGEYWEPWDHFGEEMADAINKEFNRLAEKNNELKQENEALKKFVKINFSDMMAEKMEEELKE